MISPRGSKISADQLLSEVDEYFNVGAEVRPGDTVLDVGANVGTFSLRVAERCKGDVSLFCFEPSPETYRALKSNFERNPVLRATRHAIFPVGLTSIGSRGQECSFFHFRYFPTNSTFDLANKRREFEMFFEDRGRRFRGWLERTLSGSRLARGLGSLVERGVASVARSKPTWWVMSRAMGLEEVKVPLETLDEVIRRNEISNVDLLKIDVEGFELNVLEGLGPGSWSRIRQIVIETNSVSGVRKRIEALLASNGFHSIQVAHQKTHDNGLDSVMLLASREADAQRQVATAV